MLASLSDLNFKLNITGEKAMGLNYLFKIDSGKEHLPIIHS